MRIRRTVPVASPRAAQAVDLHANVSAAMAAVLFGASVVAVRVAVRDVPPVSLAVLRMGQGSLLLVGVLLVVAPELLRSRWERLRLFALLGFVLFALFPLTFNIGLQHTEASRGAVMLATMPIWSALLGRIAGERLAGRQVIGVWALGGWHRPRLRRARSGVRRRRHEPGRRRAPAPHRAARCAVRLDREAGSGRGPSRDPYDLRDAVRGGAALAGSPCRGLGPGGGAAGLAAARPGRVPRRARRVGGVPVVDLGAVPDHSYAGRGLREPEPDRCRPARNPAPGRTAQSHVRAGFAAVVIGVLLVNWPGGPGPEASGP